MNRSIVRQCATVFGILGITSAFGGIYRMIRPNLLIVYYHKIVNRLSDIPPDSCQRLTGEIVTAEVFDEQMKYLSERYDIVSFEELFNNILCGSESRKNAAAITFDDAYREVYNTAWPILKKYNIPATIFCPGEVILKGEKFKPLWVDKLIYILDKTKLKSFQIFKEHQIFNLEEHRQKRSTFLYLVNYLRLLTSKERNYVLNMLAEKLRINVSDKELKNYYITPKHIKEMQESGQRFEPHTMTHADLAKSSEEEIIKEVKQSKEVIERITGRQCKYFSYPFGEKHSFDKLCINTLKKNGFIGAVSTIDGINHYGDDPYKLKRVLSSGQHKHLFTFRCSGLSALLKKLTGVA